MVKLLTRCTTQDTRQHERCNFLMPNTLQYHWLWQNNDKKQHLSGCGDTALGMNFNLCIAFDSIK
eukprot:m.292815 g.292815  ORF g.292815 m.292815 type:complete len:65 (-) comp15846_c0_seq1:4201-4395(-)